MKTLRILVVLGTLISPGLLSGQTTGADSSSPIEGTLALGGGVASVNGGKGRFEQNFQESDSFGGIENLHYSKDTSDTATFTLDGRAIFGNDDFLLNAKWADPDKWYFNFGYQSFRTFYDASGGFFGPTNTFLPVDGTALHLDRSHFWFEFGFTPPDSIHFKLRYDLNLRQGSMDSTEWGDITIPGYGNRNIVPTVLNLNEHTQTISAEVSKSTEVQDWTVNIHDEHTSLDDSTNAVRQPGTTIARDLTTTTLTTSDMFSSSGRYERHFGDKFSFTAGLMISSLDTNLNDASRIYGASFDAPFSLVSVNRQARDEGFYGMGGGGELKDYVGNINFDYRPAKHWQTTAAFRVEDEQTSNLADWVDTNVGTTGGATSLTDSSALSNEHWLYTDEQFEVLYTGWRNWTWNVRGDWGQGTGNLVQDSIDLDTAASTAFNNTDYDRYTEKYTVMGNWYARRGLTFSGQFYYRLVSDKYNPVIDSTPADYPEFITNESIATSDFNLRMTWRPMPLLSFITRYDLQRSGIRDTMTGLAAVDSSKFTSNIISETVTTNPFPRLYVTASVNLAFNQLGTPATDTTVLKNGDSNFTDGSLTTGYALDKISDLDLDYSIYTAINFVNDAATTLPFGADEHENTVSLTWVRRQTKHLVYTVKLTYATYRDGAVDGLNNYTAGILYAKVQYRF